MYINNDTTLSLSTPQGGEVVPDSVDPFLEISGVHLPALRLPVC